MKTLFVQLIANLDTKNPNNVVNCINNYLKKTEPLYKLAEEKRASWSA